VEEVALLAALLAGYLLGSVSFAIVVSRLFGLSDPRSFGSGNPGATNVLRSGSKLAALLTLLGDALKGAVAVWLVRWLGADYGLGQAAAAWAGAAAFVGHLYPVFFHFRGGKGVATFLGVLLAVDPWLGLAACAVWALVALAFRYSSAASLSSAVAAPVIGGLIWGVDALLAAVAVMSALLVARHRQNIAQLRAGKERKIGAAPPPPG